MNKLLIICGPTATGKTALAVSLGELFNAELVSADSRHVYKGLDILTGKDRPSDGTKIWATDLVELQDSYSVSQYQHVARCSIQEIQMRGVLPILVGGTGLYIRSVTEHIDTVSVPPNSSLRALLDRQTVAELQHKLQFLDSSKWGSMNPSDRANPRRLVRAIEIATWNSTHPIARDQAPAFDALWIGLTAPLDGLKKNIEQRVRRRFAQGVVDEVKSLGPSISSDLLPVSTSLGLSVVRKLIHGQLTQDDAITQWTALEFAYAKRQHTWFRKISDIHWFDISRKNYQTDVEALVGAWYS